MNNADELQPMDCICVMCGDRFVVAPGEQRFLLARELRMPKRCKPCRVKRTVGCGAPMYRACSVCGDETLLSVAERASGIPPRCSRCARGAPQPGINRPHRGQDDAR